MSFTSHPLPDTLSQGNSTLPGSAYEPGTPYYEDLMARNPGLNGTDFAEMNYFRNNFNDLPSTAVALFELMVVNDWHVMVNAYVTLTSRAARLYFVLFHITAVIIFMKFVRGQEVG